MSNTTLRHNVLRLCEAYQREELTLRELARQVYLHADAFEGLPFEYFKELRGVAFSLETQADFADVECEYQAEVERLLSALKECTLKIPN